MTTINIIIKISFIIAGTATLFIGLLNFLIPNFRTIPYEETVVSKVIGLGLIVMSLLIYLLAILI